MSEQKFYIHFSNLPEQRSNHQSKYSKHLSNCIATPWQPPSSLWCTVKPHTHLPQNEFLSSKLYFHCCQINWGPVSGYHRLIYDTRIAKQAVIGAFRCQSDSLWEWVVQVAKGDSEGSEAHFQSRPEDETETRRRTALSACINHSSHPLHLINLSLPSGPVGGNLIKTWLNM